MRYALISPVGGVLEILDEPFPVAPPFHWVEDPPPEVESLRGWSYDGTTWSPPAPEASRPRDRLDRLIDELAAKGTLDPAAVTRVKG